MKRFKLSDAQAEAILNLRLRQLAKLEEIKIRGELERLHSPKDAIAHGIGMVHQHFMLADYLTVLENIVLGSEPKKGIRIDFDAARSRILELSEQYGMALNPDANVEDLTIGERQRVEIMKVLYRGATILILDEPTAVLVPQEVDELFSSLRELQAEVFRLVDCRVGTMERVLRSSRKLSAEAVVAV